MIRHLLIFYGIFHNEDLMTQFSKSGTGDQTRLHVLQEETV